MKTNLIKPMTLAMAVLISIAGIHKVDAANSKKVEAVLYQDKWIPFVQLKEVTIQESGKSKSAVCEVAEHNGKLIPSVQLKEVTIKSSGMYDEKDIPSEIVNRPHELGYKVPVVKRNGVYIPSVTSPEITVVGERTKVYTMADNGSAFSSDKGTLRMSARQTFDKLAVFMATKASEIIRHMVPGVSVVE